MTPIPLKLSAKSRTNRWFAYFCLAVMMGSIGALIAYEGYKQYRDSQGQSGHVFIAIGVLLPIIMVGGEMIRFRAYCGKIQGTLCVDCRHEFTMKELVRTGRCPACRSKRVIGLQPDDDDLVVVSLL